MTASDQGFEFDSLARRPMYQACPRWLIEHCAIDDRSTVMDLGCGSGILTQLLLERFPDAPNFRVLAIDPSEAELQIARSRIRDPRVTFLRGSAQEVSSLVETSVDAILMCNLLHLLTLDERRSVLAAALALLRPGGYVGANTLFYEGGIEPQTKAFYLSWLMGARRAVSRASSSWSAPASAPTATQRLSPAQHEELFRSIGFVEVHVEELQLAWGLEDWEALSRYSAFIRGALSPDVDLALGSGALIEGARSAWASLGVESVRRGWLHCVARRPA